MNATILAARTATALAAIEAETRRLGGDLTIAPVRGDAAHRQVHTLEAIATALAGIGEPAVEVAEEPHEVEAVEAVITVVKEPAKGRRGK